MRLLLGCHCHLEHSKGKREKSTGLLSPYTPGDNVRLEFEADGGKFKASSPVLTVPEPAYITPVDTATVTVNHTDWSETYLQISADLPDRKGEDNWYCIEILKYDSGMFSFKDDGPDLTVSRKGVISIQDIEDPVLLDGNAPETNDMALFNTIGDGSFVTFSDAMFRDGTAHLKMNVNGGRVKGINLNDLLIGLHDDNAGTYDRELDRCLGSQHVGIHLSHCSEATYNYLKALRAISSPNYMPEVVEPVTIPVNITGGTGYVDIVNTTTFRMDLPDEEYLWRN